jgi:hypothetical protein
MGQFGASFMMRVLQYSCAVGAALLLACGGAHAGDNSIYYSPQLSSTLTAPQPFTGLYIGELTGLASSRLGNFFTSGQPLRYQAALVAGWNVSVTNGIVAGLEVQAAIDTDFLETADPDVFAVGRVGFLSDDRFMTYLLGGVGYMAHAPAYEVGIGYEWMASDNLSLRLEGMGISQIGNSSSGISLGGISAARLTTGAIWHFDGDDLEHAPPPGDATDFTGSYAGLYAGAYTDPNYHFFTGDGHGLHETNVAVGGLAGWSMALNDSVRLGGEAQLGLGFDTSTDVSVDALALGHVGYVVTPGLMPYAAAGVGSIGNKGAYALGGGLEYALWGKNTLRGEALALGKLSGGDAGITAGRVTFGTLFHFD